MNLAAALAQIKIQEFGNGEVPYEHNPKIFAACLIVDRTFRAAGNEPSRRYWTTAERQEYARQVQQVMAKDAYLSSK